MPDVVSNDELNALAAEYVLGTLDYEERKGAAALLEVDATFRGIVRIWERRFGELHLMVEAVEPDPQLWARIKPKVPGIEQVALAIPSHAEKAGAAAAPAVSTAEAAAVPAAEGGAAEPTAEAAALPAAEGAAAEPTAEAAAAEGTAPAAGETPPAESKPAAVAEAELKLAELAALLPVAAEQGSPGQTEPTPDDGMHTHAPDVVPRGFVPPAPMSTRGTPPVVEVPVHKAGRGWIAATVMMGLVAVVLAGLISAWRFFPERLPAQLRAYSVLNLAPPLPPKSPSKARPKLAPFDE
jgi:hypothetical protein